MGEVARLLRNILAVPLTFGASIESKSAAAEVGRGEAPGTHWITWDGRHILVKEPRVGSGHGLGLLDKNVVGERGDMPDYSGGDPFVAAKWHLMRDGRVMFFGSDESHTDLNRRLRTWGDVVASGNMEVRDGTERAHVMYDHSPGFVTDPVRVWDARHTEWERRVNEEWGRRSRESAREAAADGGHWATIAGRPVFIRGDDSDRVDKVAEQHWAGRAGFGGDVRQQTWITPPEPGEYERPPLHTQRNAQDTEEQRAEPWVLSGTRRLMPDQVDISGYRPRQVRMLPVDSFMARQRRADAIPGKVAEFLKSWRDGRKVAPLLVADTDPGGRSTGSGRFLILDGHHRYWAAKESGLDVLPAVWMTAWDSELARTSQPDPEGGRIDYPPTYRGGLRTPDGGWSGGMATTGEATDRTDGKGKDGGYVAPGTWTQYAPGAYPVDVSQPTGGNDGPTALDGGKVKAPRSPSYIGPGRRPAEPVIVVESITPDMMKDDTDPRTIGEYMFEAASVSSFGQLVRYGVQDKLADDGGPDALAAGILDGRTLGGRGGT